MITCVKIKRRAWDPLGDQPIAAQPLLEYITNKVQDEEKAHWKIQRRPQSARTVVHCMSDGRMSVFGLRSGAHENGYLH